MGGMNLVAKHHPAFIVELHGEPEQNRVLSLLGELGYTVTHLERGRKFPFHILATAGR